MHRVPEELQEEGRGERWAKTCMCRAKGREKEGACAIGEGGMRPTVQETNGLREHEAVVVPEDERLELGAAHKERGWKQWAHHR